MSDQYGPPEDQLNEQLADRPVVYVDTDHNPDRVRIFYEIPDVLAQEVRRRRRLDSWPLDVENDPRAFAQALADALAYEQGEGRA